MSDEDYFSNEAIASRAEGVEGEGGKSEAVEEPVEDQVDEPVAEADPKPEAATPDGDDAPVEDEQVAQEPEPDPYEVRYQEAQKVIGRQGNELGELRKQVEALMQAQQQAEAYEDQPVFQGRVPQSEHELLEMAAGGDEAWGAYEFALQHAPQLLPNVLAEVQAYDQAWAEQMRLDYQTRLIQSQYGDMAQQVQQATLAQQQAQAVQQITAGIEGFDQIREQVAQVVEQMPHLMGSGSPQEIQAGLEFAARLVKAESQQSALGQVQQQQQAQSQQMRQQAAVEVGTPAAAPAPAEEDPAADIANAIFAQDKQRRETISGL